MPLNKLMRLREPHKREVVHQVRDMFLEHYKTNPDLFYKDDVRQVEEMQFLLQRCIIYKRKNVQESFNCLVEMLKWRKEKRIKEITASDIPVEYYMCGACFQYEPDKFGNKTLYIRTQLLRSIPELRNSFKEYLRYLIYQVDDNVDGQSWSVIFDLTNTGWTNYDIDLLMYFLQLLREYFPVNLDYVLAINFPWVASAVWTIAKRLIPPERRDVVVFISEKEIFNYIDEENVPDFLNGSCKREHKIVPKCNTTTVEYLLSVSPQISARRIREIIRAFSEILPKEHVDKMYTQLKESGRL